VTPVAISAQDSADEVVAVAVVDVETAVDAMASVAVVVDVAADEEDAMVMAAKRRGSP
jgi:hypothetical protein